jgi:hypothetical protein
MKKYSNFLTTEEIEAQITLSDILYNGSESKSIAQTESIMRQNEYRSAVGEEDQRETALAWINAMTNMEFQTRLKQRTLPDFDREVLICKTDSKIPKDELVRMTNHPYSFLSDEEMRVGLISQGYTHRNELRYLSTDDFITEYYSEY